MRGAGAQVQTATTPARRRVSLGRRWLASLLAGALLALSLMAWTGIGTGPGPLRTGGGLELGITREVGAEFTEGNILVGNHGPFDARIESIRPLPVGEAGVGMPVTAVEVAHVPPGTGDLLGMVDGPGYERLPRERRHPPAGYVVRGSHDSTEILVRVRLDREGTWSYRGYEVVYRHGPVRHRTVVDVTLVGCAPTRATPGCSS